MQEFLFINDPTIDFFFFGQQFLSVNVIDTIFITHTKLLYPSLRYDCAISSKKNISSIFDVMSSCVKVGVDN